MFKHLLECGQPNSSLFKKSLASIPCENELPVQADAYSDSTPNRTKSQPPGAFLLEMRK